MEEEKQDKTSIDKPKRDEKGRLLPGYTANPNGGPTMTEEEKIIRKATKKVIEAYEDKLAGMLPQLEPVLREKALSGDMMAIKEVHDRVMGKPLQRIGNPDGSSIKINILPEIAKQNGVTNPSTIDDSAGQA